MDIGRVAAGELIGNINNPIYFQEAQGFLFLEGSYGGVQKYKDLTNFKALLNSKTELPVYGLCGISLKRSENAERIEECLNINQVIGFKIHLDGEGLRLSSQKCDKCNPRLENGYIDQLEFVARKLKQIRSKGIILIHFSDMIEEPGTLFKPWGSDLRAEEREEVKLFIELAAKYPSLNFVIAHAGLGQSINLNGLLQIAQHYQTNPKVKKNIYLDLSAILHHAWRMNPCRDFTSTTDQNTNLDTCPEIKKAYDVKKIKDIIPVLKEFGLERVFFGSDFHLHEELQFFRFHPDLNQEQKEMILWRNAKKLIRSFESQ